MVNFETYGKLGFLKGTYYLIKNRLFPPKYNIGLETYNPSIKKGRLALGCIGIVICVVVPLITFLAILPVRWMLK